MTTRTLWLGRARAQGEQRERCVRVWTDGEPPASDDAIEEIADPFAAAQLHLGGSGNVWEELAALQHASAGVARTVGELHMQPPVRPSKVVCVGRNYRAHAVELGNEVPSEPLLFFKPPSALWGSGSVVELPRGFARIDMEAELVVVIGRRATRVDPNDALHCVVGYTLGNDVSCRDLQNAERQWTRAKGFDGFGPLGPWIRIVEPNFAISPQARIRGRLDGELRQDAPLADMVFSIATLVSYITQCMTLEPGDVIFTGTPDGVSPLQPGQRTVVELDGWPLAPLSTVYR